jgi:hypothetical protein
MLRAEFLIVSFAERRVNRKWSDNFLLADNPEVNDEISHLSVSIFHFVINSHSAT